MSRRKKLAFDPVKSLLLGETPTPQFREMLDRHSPLLMKFIQLSMVYYGITRKELASKVGDYSERHIGRVLSGELKKTDEYYTLVFAMINVSRLVDFLNTLYSKKTGTLIMKEILPTITSSQRLVSQGVPFFFTEQD